MARAELGLPDNKPISGVPDWGLNHPAKWLLPRFTYYRRHGVWTDGSRPDSWSRGLLADVQLLQHLLAYWIQEEGPHKTASLED